jgi:mono/diheme cytochrome c family protein
MLRTSSFFFLLTVSSFLFFSCGNKKTEEEIISGDTTSVTYSSQIAPLIYKNCSPCHRPGEAGPFNLLSYNDVKKNANRIKFATQTHFMPPWPADPTYTHFIGERTLTQNEIDIIKKWIDNKMPLGDSTKIPPAPQFYTGSFFGKPDLVVKLQEAVKLKAGEDNFLVVKYPYEIAHDTFVRAIEFVPNKRKLIHHVNGHTISFDDKKKATVFEGKNALPDMQENFSVSFKEMGLANDDGTFPLMTPNTVYFLPGYTPPQYPDDVGGYVLKKKGAFLLKNIHYGPSREDVNDSSYINVFFSNKAPLRPIKEIQLGTFGVSPIEPPLEIPANQIKTFHTQWKVPQDISLLSVNPHMHLLGKNFLAYAISPQGDTIKLIRINKWDFRWQYYYTFPKMMKIPAGSIMHAYATYDNTKENLLNPFSPPQTIIERKGNESMKTTEEMFQFIFTFVPYKAGDENVSLERK